MSTTSDLLAWTIAQLRDKNISPFLNVAPQNTATLTITYPIVVVNLVSSISNYSLNNGELRYERFNINISIFDNKSDQKDVMSTLSNIQGAFEGKSNITTGDSIIMGTYLASQNGPVWLNKEHYWAMYNSWEVLVSNKTLGKH